MSNYVLFIPIFALIGGVIVSMLADLLPYPSAKSWVAVVAVGVSLAGVLNLTRYSWPMKATLYLWLPESEGLASVAVGYHLDALSFALLLCALFAAFCLILYAVYYVAAEPKRQLVFYFSVLSATVAFVNMVLSGNLLVTYVGLQVWIVASFAVTAFWHHGIATTPAIARSFILASLPSTGVLVAALILAGRNPSLAFDNIDPQSLAPPLLFLILMAAAAVSNQYPFHPWTAVNHRVSLPAAALLGVVFAPLAGVYLLARFHAIAGPQIDSLWHQSVTIVGALTMVAGSVYTVKQTHLRGITVFIATTQFGYAFLGLGLNTPASITAALLTLLSASLACSGMMICAGIIERSTGTGNVLKLGRIAKRMPLTAMLFIFFSLSLAGVPFPTLGFFAKWMILGAAFEAGHAAFGILILVVDVLVFVMLMRTVDWVFFRMRFRRAFDADERSRVPLISAGLLAVPIFAFGLAPHLFVDWIIKPALSVLTHVPASELKVSLAGGFTSASFLSSAITFLVMLLPPILGLMFYMVALGDRDPESARPVRGNVLKTDDTASKREAGGHADVAWFPWVINTSGIHLGLWRVLLGSAQGLWRGISPAEAGYSPLAILLAALTILLMFLE